MAVIPVNDPADPRIADYADAARPERLRDRGLFIAEGRLVVRTLLEGGRFRTRSLLVTETARRSLADALEGRTQFPVFVGPLSLLGTIVGYSVHRGCLAAGERAALSALDMSRALENARIVLVVEGVGNPDNVGGLFRNAAAFGVGAILLGPGCGDPLYRKAIRVSMGAALRVPFGELEEWPAGLARLRTAGFTIAALTPRSDAINVARLAEMAGAPAGRVALLVGAECEGLTPESAAAADIRVRIPMAPGVDSLNVATAAAVALHRLMAPSGP